MAERRFSEDEPVMVSIRCITYNHAPYIRQCLEGFVMQKTNFRFQAVVHDDASTDGTTDIVREYAEKYPDIIIPMYEEENRWSKHDGTLLTCMLPLMTGKYWAECEGDDYWIDQNHLQRMVDCLECDNELGLCYASCRYYYQDEQKLHRKKIGGTGTSFDSLLRLNQIPTFTAVFRTDLYLNSIDYRKRASEGKGWLMSDYPTWLWFAANSKIKYVNAIIGVYRVLNESASHSLDFRNRANFILSSRDIREKYCMDFTHGRNKDYLIKLINNQCNWNLMNGYLRNGCLAYAISCHKKLYIYDIKSFIQYIIGFVRIKLFNNENTASC